MKILALSVLLMAFGAIGLLATTWDGAAAPDQAQTGARAPVEPACCAGERMEPETGRIDATELAASEPHCARPTRWIKVSQMEEGDAARLARVNKNLTAAGRDPIPDDSTILIGDIAAFRGIVDSAIRDHDTALQAWRQAAETGLTQQWGAVLASLQRGETEGLPYQSESNPMRRRHRYEAIRLVAHEGESYVLRVSVAEEPRLASSGEAIKQAADRLLFDFDSMVRSLFQKEN